MNNTKRKIIIFVSVILLIAGVYVVKGENFFKFNNQINFGNKSSLDSSEVSTFFHMNGDFSFDYPSNFTFTDLTETDDITGEEMETVIFHGKGTKENFQIVVSAFDDEPVTLIRVKNEVPDLKLSDAQEISIQGARGVIFSSTDADSKMATREIWFSQGGILYQISTFPEFDSQMADILSTWKWFN